MKAEDIDNMQAGRHMDLLIATYVLKLNPDLPVLSYSKDIAAAWLAIEKLRELGLKPNIEDSDNNQWTCAFVKWTGEPLGWQYISSSIADTAPLAICRAALKALTSEDK